MKPLIYIDGAAGTTGLEIRVRLAERTDLVLHTLPENERKDVQARAGAMNRADVAILCLPEQAAQQAVGIVENPAMRILDASTAHRTAAEWVYGFAELEPEQRGRIAKSAPLTVVLAYPSPYHVAMSSLGYQRIYRALQDMPGVCCEHSCRWPIVIRPRKAM